MREELQILLVGIGIGIFIVFVIMPLILKTKK